MAINLDQLKQKTREGKGFNAPGAAEKLRFLQNIFARAAKTAESDPQNKSLATPLEDHASMFGRLADKDLLQAEGEKAEGISTALLYLTGFHKYLNSKTAWQPHTPLSYLNDVICKDQQEKDKLADALQSVTDILELGAERKAEKKEEPKQDGPKPEAKKEAPKQEAPQVIEMANVPPVQPKPEKKKDPRTTPELYEQALKDEVNAINLPGKQANKPQDLENDIDLEDEEAPEKLTRIIGKKLALKYREYGPFDPEKVDEVGSKFEEFPFFVKFLEDYCEKKGVQQLKGIALGDTESLEKEIRKELVATAKLPDKSWWPISVNAKDFTESVKKKLRSEKFANMDLDDQIGLYHKILAARTSVDAVRGSFRGKSLDKDIDLGSYFKTLDALDRDGSAVTEALKNMIGREGKETVRSWACEGHGGLLEEKVKEEVRNMAKEGDYKLGNMPQRYRPTVKERLEDIQNVLQNNEKWSAMNIRQKKFLVSEYALLQKDARRPGGMDAVLGDISEHNRDAEEFAASEKFGTSVNNIEQVRLNLAGLDLNEAADAFRKSQTKAAQEEAKRALAHKTTDLVRKALEEKNAKKEGKLEEKKPDEGKKEEKNVNLPTA